jgi:hypothetical protein
MSRVFAVLLALSALPAAASAPPSAAPSAAPRQAPQYWFKTYSTAPYKQFWTIELAVKDFRRDLPKVAAQVKEEGGVLSAPMEDFAGSDKGGVQQMSFSLSLRRAKGLLRRLRRIGDAPDPRVRAAGAPIPLNEVEAKIETIQKERREHARALAEAPAAAAAQEEILEHLLLVRDVARRAETQVLVNLTVRTR